MVTEPETIDVHLLLSIEFARGLTQRMGYNLPLERIQRIADEARVAISAGLCASDAYAHAVDLELMMYGDPLSTVQPIGLLPTR